MTMALILAVMRRLIAGERLVRTGDWQGWAPTSMLGHRLGRKRPGIVGMGRIGRAPARRARSFGMTVHYHNRPRVAPAVAAELEAPGWASPDPLRAHPPTPPATS